MENALKRNLKYTIYTATKMLGMCFGVMALIIFLDGGFSSKWEIEYFTVYIVTFGMFMFNIRIAVSDMRVILSFCSRRKDYYMAKLTLNVAMIIIFTLVCSVVNVFIERFSIENTLFAASVLIAASAASTLGGILTMYMGMIGYMLFCGIIGGAVAFIVFFTTEELTRGGVFGNWSALMPVLAVAFMIVSSFAEWKAIRNYEVRI